MPEKAGEWLANAALLPIIPTKWGILPNFVEI